VNEDPRVTIPTLRVLIAHGSDEVAAALTEVLDRRHSVVATTGTIVELKQLFHAYRPDLLVVGVEFPDGDGIETVIELGRDEPVPSVVATAARSLRLVEKAMRDHVMAYLIEPVRREDLEAAIVVAWSRFEQLRELEGQVDDLKVALAHRKIIERAKGVLMAAESVTEAEAFATLRRRAQDARKRMVDIANDILSGCGDEL